MEQYEIMALIMDALHSSAKVRMGFAAEPVMCDACNGTGEIPEVDNDLVFGKATNGPCQICNGKGAL